MDALDSALSESIHATFATIAQSLATAIALLGAFVLYRLQTLHEEIQRRSEALLEVSRQKKEKEKEGEGGESRLEDAHTRHDFLAVFEMSSVQITTPNRAVDYARRRMRALLAHEKALLRWLWVSLFLTVGLITVAVAVLSRTPWIVSVPGAAEITLDAGIAWYLACLVTYALLLRSALASSVEHEK